MMTFIKRFIIILITFGIAIVLDTISMPNFFEAIRPNWTTMTMLFWAIKLQRHFGIGSAWLMGLLLDISKSFVWGLHGFTFALLCYIVKRYYPRIKSFTLPVKTCLIPILLIIQSLITIWVNGILGNSTPSFTHWVIPIVVSSLLWPILNILLSEICDVFGITDK
ncbi:rod shape-determining protein MreD [Ignatzschineria cameli]|uniref:Rod shape-determining protein MreD n=1 Tax=Ignatzschineria cameli TaxID=2182793 RepID=A0A2U2AQ38_9GAMM|nr:rod shape-determining protein MreD [Ignatzschineria cameli]PWD85745.1 rod shape-determining protein MreD [Ignatzschineria cameli]PWD89374.1 rod shape-determining protein MreD [Ignatzschineria cameli]PWD90846.1 rod shape-determining protein MreD [Ignatzschineria cameli]PWD91634.1 rod shape-determining protein MreD [Ignatzschineria cameli]